jgi:LPXTG-motif cell wall-anchored protein
LALTGSDLSFLIAAVGALSVAGWLLLKRRRSQTETAVTDAAAPVASVGTPEGGQL